MCSGLLIEPWLISGGAGGPGLHPTHSPDRWHTCGGGGDGAEMVKGARRARWRWGCGGGFLKRLLWLWVFMLGSKVG